MFFYTSQMEAKKTSTKSFDLIDVSDVRMIYFLQFGHNPYNSKR